MRVTFARGDERFAREPFAFGREDSASRWISLGMMISTV